MVTVAVMFVVIFLLALGIPVAIWLVTESETDQSQVLDRESAERRVRHDGRVDSPRRRDDEW